MTITYSLNVANARLTGFSKLLLRWKGSIYKLLYREMAIFCTLYYCLSFVYRYLLSENQRTIFEKVTLYCEAFTNLVPLTFVLGFYVSIVVTRWWQQFMMIPWPDKCVMLVTGLVHGMDERGRIIRRTLARHLLLLMTLTCQAVSTSVRRRFPTLDHVEEAGIMTKEERQVYDDIPGTHGKWWAPTVWFTNIVIRARKEGRIKDDILMQQLLTELHVYRNCCGMMFAYDWISIPLVYTQTVTIATYTYFLATVMGRQYLDPSKGYSNHDVDLYVPVFTIFEFFFFMGWLKVAEQLINPYGEDDDDFELNWCLDRNMLISYQIVDEMYQKHPKLVKDMYWDDNEPQLPYTKTAWNQSGLRAQPCLGSALNLDIEPEEVEFLPMATIMEEDNDNTYSSPPTSPQDLISIGTTMPDTNEKMQTKDGNGNAMFVSSGLRTISDSIKGSRMFNMIIGQSTENVNANGQTPPKGGHLTGTVAGGHDRALLGGGGHPVIMPPFLLKTPRKRTRTSSTGDFRPALHSAASTMHISSLDSTGGNNRSKVNLSVGYGDLPTAPVILTHRTPTRQGTPASDRRSMVVGDSRDSRDSSCDLSANFEPNNRYPGLDGFKFPTAYVPPTGVNPQSQFFNDLMPKNSNLETSNGSGNGNGNGSEASTPRVSATTSRCPSRNGHTPVATSATVISIPATPLSALEPERPLLRTDACLEPEEEEEDESPYEPNLSDENLTHFESNQSTVTSLTQLIRQSQMLKDNLNNLNE